MYNDNIVLLMVVVYVNELSSQARIFYGNFNKAIKIHMCSGKEPKNVCHYNK